MRPVRKVPKDRIRMDIVMYDKSHDERRRLTVVVPLIWAALEINTESSLGLPRLNGELVAVMNAGCLPWVKSGVG